MAPMGVSQSTRELDMSAIHRVTSHRLIPMF